MMASAAGEKDCCNLSSHTSLFENNLWLSRQQQIDNQRRCEHDGQSFKYIPFGKVARPIEPLVRLYFLHYI